MINVKDITDFKTISRLKTEKGRIICNILDVLLELNEQGMSNFAKLKSIRKELTQDLLTGQSRVAMQGFGG